MFNAINNWNIKFSENIQNEFTFDLKIDEEN